MERIDSIVGHKQDLIKKLNEKYDPLFKPKLNPYVFPYLCRVFSWQKFRTQKAFFKESNSMSNSASNQKQKGQNESEHSN